MVELPTYADVQVKIAAREHLTELDMFIHEYDPAETEDSTRFFEGLKQVLEEQHRDAIAQAKGFVDVLASDQVITAVAETIYDHEPGNDAGAWRAMIEQLASSDAVAMGDLKRAALEKRLERLLGTARDVIATALRVVSGA